MISCIYWLGPNKTEEHQEDIVLELKDGRQFSFYFNKNVTLYKTASYNKFADQMIGDEYEKMYGPSYIGKWNHLVKRWIEIIYTNVNTNYQKHIEKFLDYSKLDLVHYFLYYNIKHSDPRFKNLGEYIRELNDNFLYLSELLASIWKNRDVCFADPEKVYNEWMEEKTITLNSKILEHLLTEGLTKNSTQDIELDGEYIIAKGDVKMKIVKTIVEKLGCKERNIFFLGYGGNVFTMVPTRKFWREGYDHFNVKFKYHVEVNKEINSEERKNDFQIDLIIEMDDQILIKCEVGVGFGRRGEMTDRLSARYKFSMQEDFNQRIYNKMKIPDEGIVEEGDLNNEIS
jgi:hypothetical protein